MYMYVLLIFVQKYSTVIKTRGHILNDSFIVCTKVACVWEGPVSSQIFNICYRVPYKQPTCDYMTIPTEETE